MKKKICSICLVSLAMLAFAPLNTGAKALEDSFYSEEQVEESTGISDFLEKDSDDFTSGDEEITDSFSSQIEEQVESNNDESNNDWTPLDTNPKYLLNTTVKQKCYHLKLLSRQLYLIILKMEVLAIGI